MSENREANEVAEDIISKDIDEENDEFDENMKTI